MGNVRNMHCPEMNIRCSVGKNGSLWAYPDRVHKFEAFLEATKGKALIMTAEEDAYVDGVDDRLWLDFEEGRDYVINPVTKQDVDDAFNERRAEATPGWAKATPEQVSALTEAVVEGKLGYIHDVRLHTDAFKKV